MPPGVAQRAIDQGLIGRYGSLDSTDGGIASRYSLSGKFAQSSDIGQTDINAYVIHSSLQLFNNFTYFLDDPVHGDQFEQSDRRGYGGLDLHHTHDHTLFGRDSATTLGGQLRGDLTQVELLHTERREVLADGVDHVGGDTGYVDQQMSIDEHGGSPLATCHHHELCEARPRRSLFIL
mgnify:CR=1 FL=1